MGIWFDSRVPVAVFYSTVMDILVELPDATYEKVVQLLAMETGSSTDWLEQKHPRLRKEYDKALRQLRRQQRIEVELRGKLARALARK